MYGGYIEDGYHDTVVSDAAEEDSCSEIDEEDLEVRLYSLIHFDTNTQCSATEANNNGTVEGTFANSYSEITSDDDNNALLKENDDKIYMFDRTGRTKISPINKETLKTDVNISSRKIPELSDYLISRNDKSGSSPSILSDVSSLDSVTVVSERPGLKKSRITHKKLPTVKGSVLIETDSDETRSERSCVVVDSTVTVDDSNSDDSDVTICDSESSDSDSSDSEVDIRSIEVDKVMTTKATPHADSTQEFISLISEEEGVHDDIKLNVEGGMPIQCNKLSDKNDKQAKRVNPAEVLIPSEESDINVEEPECTLEDIQNSLGECDWSTKPRDVAVLGRMSNRYYQPINVRCHNCNERGHLSKVCPQPKKIPACLLCGERGHTWKSCPNAHCYNCYQSGHTGKECDQPRRKLWEECNTCKMQGHKHYECPNRWRQFHLTTSADHFVKGDNTENGFVYCCNCGQEGHFHHDCLKETMDRRNKPTWPFITRYRLRQEYEQLLKYQENYDMYMAGGTQDCEDYESQHMPKSKKRKKSQTRDPHDAELSGQGAKKKKAKLKKGKRQKKSEVEKHEKQDCIMYETSGNKNKRKWKADIYQSTKRFKYDENVSGVVGHENGIKKNKFSRAETVMHSFVQSALKEHMSSSEKKPKKKKKKKNRPKENDVIVIETTESSKNVDFSRGKNKRRQSQFVDKADTVWQNHHRRDRWSSDHKKNGRKHLNEGRDIGQSYNNQTFAGRDRQIWMQKRGGHYNDNGASQHHFHSGKHGQQANCSQYQQRREHTGNKKWNSKKGTHSFKNRRGFVASGNY